MNKAESPIRGIIKSLGLVFGDIGTSPIYTLTVIFLTLQPTEANIRGIISLVFWSISILVSAEYAWLATSLGKKGEGGTIVLRELLIPLLKSGRAIGLVMFLSFIGISLIIGDGVITPAISILSAVEGVLLIPGFEGMNQNYIIVVAAIIAIGLFMFQRKGTERVARIFGPIMLCWFSILAVSGVSSIMTAPSIMLSISPYYAISFMMDNGMSGFFVLSEVILCATGGEALYADMGHLGRAPILKAWYLVFVALIMNYMGQGAFLLSHPGAKNILFSMIYDQASFLYIPFLVMSIVATVIASQAMISGMFSIVYQAINIHIMPMFKIDYTSEDMRSQIYIGAVNWFLLAAVLFIMFEFRQSSRLAAAYGLAVTGDMVLTGGLMTFIFFFRRDYFRSGAAFAISMVVLVYFASNMYKIPHGGYWSIIIALVPFTVILIYTRGQKKLYRELKPMPIPKFLQIYKKEYWIRRRIEGTALFFIRDVSSIPPYIVRTMFQNGIVYDDNILVAIIKRDDPFGVTAFFKEDFAKGLRVFEIQMGYMEFIDVEEILKEAGISEQSIFYGVEEILTQNVIWKVFNVIKKLTPSFVQFHKLPYEKLHGVITRIEM